MKSLSVCIPTYEMHGLGEKFLKQSFDILTRQTFHDFEVVISDHSKTNVIKDLCEIYKDKLDINYYKNSENVGSSSANINNAIKKARGKLIKVLFQDDFLYSENSLQETVEAFDLAKDAWLVSACIHTTDGIRFYRPFYPKYHDHIHLGRNTISSPSVLTIKNETPLLFDENLLQRMDCDYYKRCHDRFGDPRILNTITVVNRAGPHQISQMLITTDVADTEYAYLLKKYGVLFPRTRAFLHQYIGIAKRIMRTLRNLI